MATRFDKGTWRKWARRYYYFKKILPPKDWSTVQLKNEVQALEIRNKAKYYHGSYLTERSKMYQFLARLWYSVQGFFVKGYALTYMWYLKNIKHYGSK